jgi:hypothetical protein
MGGGDIPHVERRILAQPDHVADQPDRSVRLVAKGNVIAANPTDRERA